MAQYFFKTVWKVNAPVAQVWEVIKDAANWPQWWRGVLSVREIEKGNTDGIGVVSQHIWKSRLPYKLMFTTVSTLIDTFHTMEGIAYGELIGTGRWEFSEENGWTTVTYFWNVKTTVPWMNFFAPFLGFIFKWNHDVVMHWGGTGIGKKLNCKVVV